MGIPFASATCFIRCIVPNTTFFPYSGVSCASNHRRMWFFNSNTSNIIRFLYVEVTSKSFETTMCPTTFWETSPSFFYSPDISTFDALNFWVEPKVMALFSRRLAYLCFFFSIAIAGVNASNAFSKNKILTKNASYCRRNVFVSAKRVFALKLFW